MKSSPPCDFLDLFTPAALSDLRPRTVRVRRGQIVLARGDASGDVFILQAGRLQVVQYSADGREICFRELGAGQLFGELSAIDGASRSVGVVAMSDSRLLAINAVSFRAALRLQPAVADWMIRRLTAQIRGLTDQLFEMGTLSVRDRLHCELIRLARMRTGAQNEPAPTHAELATRIGTNRETVTRELKLLAERNLIRSGRRQIEFLDVPALENIVAGTRRMPVGEPGLW